MFTITILVSAGSGLGNQTIHGRQENGLQWTMWTQIDDLDFADDLAPLSHTQ